MAQKASNRPPNDLGPAGKRFWRDVRAEYDLGEGEARLLVEACRCVDELETLRAALVDAPPVVEGSTGQPRPHPLYDELRRHREVLVRLCDAMRLPAPGEDEGRPVASLRARRAAQIRWGARDGSA